MKYGYYIPQHIGFQVLNDGRERVPLKDWKQSEALAHLNVPAVQKNQQKPHPHHSSSPQSNHR